MRRVRTERAPQRYLAARLRPFAAVACASLALGGCASSSVDANYGSAQQLARTRLGADLRWLTGDAERARAAAEVDDLLARPLAADDAVRIALAHSPALQAMLYDGAAESAGATQSARLPNPVFAFERLVRNEGGARELELTRSLSVSVLDLLLMPSRLRMADFRQQTARLTMASNVVQAAVAARQAWVSAVAAQQSLGHARQVTATAAASAELARRMQSVGNFSKLQRAREQAFAADAATQLARATQAALASREALVRVLGLSDAQARALQLPERLPDLPAAPNDEETVAKAALEQRLDVRLARGHLEFLAREQGLLAITSVVDDLEIGAVRTRETGHALQKGYELSLPLPLFDFGDATRTQARATYQAALNRSAQLAVDARSQVRENYGAYRTAWDVARHYRDEIVPLNRLIAEENVLRYNGMLIGVFELLADSRQQIAVVIRAIEAQRDFWLADAALQATLIGRPLPAMSTAADNSAGRAGRAGAGH